MFLCAEETATPGLYSIELGQLTFKEAPTTALPSTSRFVEVEVLCDKVFMSTCDVQNAFYMMQLPGALAQCFLFSPLTARCTGQMTVNDHPVFPTTTLTPHLKVLPMG
jgi:hypothetical protein